MAKLQVIRSYCSLETASCRILFMEVEFTLIGGGLMHNLFISIILHFLIPAVTGAAAPGCSGAVNAAD